jgi:hypothetical protein
MEDSVGLDVRGLCIISDQKMLPRLCKCIPTLLISVALLQLPAEARANNGNGTATIKTAFCEEMKLHKTLTKNSQVGCERLALVRFDYVGFDGAVHTDGEVVVLDAAADHVAKIFGTLLDLRFPIEKAKSLTHYEGNDEASMADNNTSGFNDRPVSGGSAISLHGYGLAIDLNPVQNPFVQRANGTIKVNPKGSENYLKRSDIRPGMAETVVNVFADNGFPIWGGDWTNPIDYQHFQVGRELALKLIHSSPSSAKAIFGDHINQYHRCRQTGKKRELCIGGTSRSRLSRAQKVTF